LNEDNPSKFLFQSNKNTNGWKFLIYVRLKIDVQPLIDVQSSNQCSISTSQTSVPQIYVLFSNSQIGVQFSNLSFLKFSNLWPFLTFSNQRPMTSLSYALNLTNKSAIDLKIWKGHRFENTLKSVSDLR